MGNISSAYQEVSVSDNGKWLVLSQCGAYVNVKCVAFFVVEPSGGGYYRITFKLLDNDNDEHSDGWSTWASRPMDKFQSTAMTQQQCTVIVDALTKA
jgi:hypothetical protein